MFPTIPIHIKIVFYGLKRGLTAKSYLNDPPKTEGHFGGPVTVK